MGIEDEKEAGLDSWRGISLVSLVVVLIAAGLATHSVFWLARPFQKMFLEMNVALPLVSQVAFHPLAGCIFPLLALAGIAKEIVLQDKRITFLANIVLVGVVGLGWMVFWEVMFMPLIEMMRSMGQQPG